MKRVINVELDYMRGKRVSTIELIQFDQSEAFALRTLWVR